MTANVRSRRRPVDELPRAAAPRRLGRLSCWTLFVLAVGLLAPLALQHTAGRPLPGVRLDGQSVPRTGSLDGFLQAHARAFRRQTVTLETGSQIFQLTHGELGAELSVAEARTDIAALGRSLNPLVALRAFWTGRYGSGHELRWRPRIVDPSALERSLRSVQRQVDRLPTPASHSPEGALVEGLPGEVLDLSATRRAVESGLRRGARWFKVDTLITPPIPAVRRFVRPRDEATVLMMRQETTYRPSQRGRATNIELSARKLDGLVLMPGEALSFNRAVGKRTLSAGFAPAHELVNGELVLGVGGGVCQVAGTLHAAAFFAGLTVEEYRAHSRLAAFGYLRPGLDTMVAWPDHARDLRETKDLRLRNPYPFPVLIRSALVEKSSDRSIVRIELYGSARPFRVDFSFEELARVPAGELRRTTWSLPSGTERVQQESREGTVILRRRTIYMPTRRVEEVVRVSYPPTPRIVLVGAG